MDDARPPTQPSLAREIGLMALAATGICSMLGAAINVIPFMLQRNVPGIGPHVLLAYGLGAIPAVLAAMAYASLSSAMPRAGGSYVFASRSLHPYLGFIASFSQWFGLSIAIGVVSYMLVPFLRDISVAIGWVQLGESLDGGVLRTTVALAFLWVFAGVNMLGVKSYARALVPLMFLMFLAGAVVIVTGFSSSQGEFSAQVLARDGVNIAPAGEASLEFDKLLAAAAILF
ncbi:MAG: APC family permease, partial [Planctomycetota bacterium]